MSRFVMGKCFKRYVCHLSVESLFLLENLSSFTVALATVIPVKRMEKVGLLEVETVLETWT